MANGYPVVEQNTGAAGDSPPPLASNASGYFGWFRKIVDVLSGTLKTAGPAASAATSTPVTATYASVGTVNSAAFTPQLGREIWLTTTGTWSGTAQVMRSIDAGSTWQPLTVGGATWGSFTGNCNEQFGIETSAAATYRLAITLTSGSLTYTIAQ